MQMSCDVIGHVTTLDQSDPSTQLPRVVKLLSTNQKVLLLCAIIGDFTWRPLAAIRARPIRTLHFKFQPIRMKQIAPQI